MDAVGCRTAWLLGVSEVAPMSTLFAATYPERTRGLVLWGTYARYCRAPDCQWGPEKEAFLDGVRERSAVWGRSREWAFPGHRWPFDEQERRISSGCRAPVQVSIRAAHDGADVGARRGHRRSGNPLLGIRARARAEPSRRSRGLKSEALDRRRRKPRERIMHDQQAAAPDDGWRRRPDMSPFTRPFRASIVARARFIEDLVADHAARGVRQYVILGAGLDTFAQRRPEIASRLLVFEIDRPGPQAWKRQRLVDLGLGIPPFLRLVPVDFEAGDGWWERLAASGFDAERPAVVASTGVSMYLTQMDRARCARSRRSLRAPRLPCHSCFRSSWRTPRCVPELSERLRGREQTARPSSASSRRPRC